MLKELKVAAIYIGAIIGAGFASGREIIVYFNNCSYFNFVIVAFLLSLLFYFFIKVPKIESKIFNILIILAMFISYIIMVSALCQLEEQLKIDNLSILVSFLCIFIAAFNIEKIKIINILSILFIVIMLIYLSSLAPINSKGNISILSSINYVGMNTLLGGVIVNEKKTDLNKAEKIKAAFLVFVIFLVLFFMVYKIAVCENLSTMPILDFSKKYANIYISAIVILLAIFTTQLSSAHIIFEKLKGKFKSTNIFIFLASLTICAYKLPYSFMSLKMYPILGYMGCIYIVVLVIKTLKKEFSFNKFSNAFNSKIHNAGHNTQKYSCRHN